MAKDTNVAPLPQNTEQTKQGQTSVDTSGKTNQISQFYPFLLMTTMLQHCCWSRFNSLFVPVLKLFLSLISLTAETLYSCHTKSRGWDLPYRAVHAWLMTSKHTVPDLHEIKTTIKTWYWKEKLCRYVLKTIQKVHSETIYKCIILSDRTNLARLEVFGCFQQSSWESILSGAKIKMEVDK